MGRDSGFGRFGSASGSEARFRDRRGLLAQENGAIRKDWGGRVPVALVYPNTYHVGMSSLGFQTVYGLLNAAPDLVCERAFAGDQGRGMLAESVESERPLTDFPVVAFSLSFELDYFNLIRLLLAAGIEPERSQRPEEQPLLLGGGPAVSANPEPLAGILDAVVVGELEPVLPALRETLVETAGADKSEVLARLARLPGLYVPAFYEARYHADGTVADLAAQTGAPLPVPRLHANDLNAFATETVIYTPRTELGDLALLEVGRGCPHACRFCLVGYCYRPVRERSPETLLAAIERALPFRERIGLVGPSVSEYSRIGELVDGMRRLGARVSTASLRVGTVEGALLDFMIETGNQTITVAPEAGTERLQRVIGKGVTPDDFLRTAEHLAGRGLRTLKCYFMLGLPTETEDDVDALIALCREAQARLGTRRGAAKLSVNVSSFVPKAHTPFQWEAMAGADMLTTRAARVRRELTGAGIGFTTDSVEESVLQAVLSRGDRRVGRALAASGGRMGKRFARALEEYAAPAAWYAHRRRPLEEVLPWSVVRMAASPEALARSNRAAARDAAPVEL